MKSYYFISDTHFGSPLYKEENRKLIWKNFLLSLENTDSELFLLGDIFDFWIEYKRAVRSDYFDILFSIKRLINSGVKVTLIRGNHDFIRGSFLEKTIGISVFNNEHIIITDNSINVTLIHGDNLKKGLKTSIRNHIIKSNFNQLLYKFVHPDIGIPFAEFISSISRKRYRKKASKNSTKYRNLAFKLLEYNNSNALIMGHTHKQELTTIDNRVYGNSGSWLKEPHAIKISGNQFSLHTINSNGILMTPESTAVLK